MVVEEHVAALHEVEQVVHRAEGNDADAVKYNIGRRGGVRASEHSRVAVGRAVVILPLELRYSGVVEKGVGGGTYHHVFSVAKAIARNIQFLDRIKGKKSEAFHLLQMGTTGNEGRKTGLIGFR